MMWWLTKSNPIKLKAKVYSRAKRRRKKKKLVNQKQFDMQIHFVVFVVKV